jgi:hypothetical protein
MNIVNYACKQFKTLSPEWSTECTPKILDLGETLKVVDNTKEENKILNDFEVEPLKINE